MFIKKLGSESHRIIAPPDSEKTRSGYVVLEQGQEVGEHTTEKREELIVILSGVATIFLGNETKKIAGGHAIYIPQEKKHNVKNEGFETLKYVYIVCDLD